MLKKIIHFVAEPYRQMEILRGIEDFQNPGTWRLLELFPEAANIIHCHNLHGGYFDLRFLPWVSWQVPVILTLHDAWLLSGHCAHSFDCERWKYGCGQCPDLTIHPGIRRDATAYNWQRKRKIFANSRLYAATPSRWLMDKVNESALANGIEESRVIPNGVDLSIFRPGDKKEVRLALDIPPDAKVLLFAANGVRQNVFKDYQMLEATFNLVSKRLSGRDSLFIVLGEDGSVEQNGGAEVRLVPYQRDQATVAKYYQAADVYVHAARAESWGLTITEALACATPVVATATGGIPEQIKALDLGGSGLDIETHGPERATGYLVAMGDIKAMCEAIVNLLADGALLERLSKNAAQDARERFDLEQQVEVYLDWYRTITAKRGVKSTADKYT
jgi:glycosyltransferase involved in cell wall biosynthesis